MNSKFNVSGSLDEEAGLIGLRKTVTVQTSTMGDMAIIVTA